MIEKIYSLFAKPIKRREEKKKLLESKKAVAKEWRVPERFIGVGVFDAEEQRKLILYFDYDDCKYHQVDDIIEFEICKKVPEVDLKWNRSGNKLTITGPGEAISKIHNYVDSYRKTAILAWVQHYWAEYGIPPQRWKTHPKIRMKLKASKNSYSV